MKSANVVVATATIEWPIKTIAILTVITSDIWSALMIGAGSGKGKNTRKCSARNDMTNEEAIHILTVHQTTLNDDTDVFSAKMQKVIAKDSEAFKMAISALERDRWIPVAEKPKSEGTYLATLDGEICGQDDPVTSICGYYRGKWDEDCVIAWRPLPEPYHPQELRNADEDTAQSGLQSAT